MTSLDKGSSFGEPENLDIKPLFHIFDNIADGSSLGFCRVLVI